MSSLSGPRQAVSSEPIQPPAVTLGLGLFSMGYLTILSGELHKGRSIWLVVLKLGKVTPGWWLLRRCFLVVGADKLLQTIWFNALIFPLLFIIGENLVFFFFFLKMALHTDEAQRRGGLELGNMSRQMVLCDWVVFAPPLRTATAHFPVDSLPVNRGQCVLPPGF